MHIPSSPLKNTKTASYQTAAHLLFLEDLNNLEHYFDKHNLIQVALISFSEGEIMPNYFDNIRKAWYELSANFSNGEVLDLGHIYEDREALNNTLNFLNNKDVLSIILSFDALPTLSACPLAKAACNITKANISLVSAALPYSLEKSLENPPLINALWASRDDLKINVFGFQSYYIDKLALAHLDKKDSELLRLGQLENNIQDIEPLIRGSHILSFDISAIKHSEAPLSTAPKAIGISAVNACQIMRYAALCNALQFINIFGYFGKGDIALNFDITAGLIAQMIWFAIEANFKKVEDYPVIPAQLQEYILICKDIDFPLSFFKNNRSDKWWFAMSEWEWMEKYIHNPFLIPCSEEDFKTACEGELPERLWRYLIKTDF